MPNNCDFDFLGLGGVLGCGAKLRLLIKILDFRLSDFWFREFRFGFCGRSFKPERFKDGFEDVVHAASMFGGNRKYISDSEAMEFVDKRLLFVAVNFIDCEKQRLAAAKQQAGEIEIRRC